MSKVVRIRELGGPEVLQFEEVAFEEPAAGELRLKIGAIGINRMEVVHRSGGFGPDTALPAVIGSEGAGTVEAIGEGVTGFSIGDRVATIPGFTTAPGFATPMPGHQLAVYGEQAYVPADMAVKLPDGMSFVEGAAVWMSYGTAYNSMVRVADVQPGEYVLLVAATSPVGIAAVQIVKAQGGIPIATTRSNTKVKALKALGVEHVIVTDEQDIPTEVDRITGGVGCRVIYDPVAGASVDKLIDALSMEGLLLIYGVLDFAPALIDPLKGLAKLATVKFSGVFGTFLVPERRAAMIDYVQKGLADGSLKPVIDATYPFHEIAEAHRHVESNRHIGKVVVIID
ncbi:zinc-dependent alcohol dehydrogenase family protein [Rhizobium lusitanum]|uniref:zinc-dependent alcohol dehydrogenase family protein n=1 Tax=Rhizobium lusitanum TaxID=293958 RepID=UPI0015741DE6|nr:zinc-dependent alcohol dehydrogenase family protein [Rhizobium lusitanum]NTJ11548.1 zinc-dependent alcohol dehydrogenase family protein [Rhizobium lusitanum]